MASKNQNVTIYAGDYLDLEVLVTYADGEPLSTSNITAKYKVAKSVKDEPIITKGTNDGIVLTTEDGTMLVTISIDSEDTEDLKSYMYYHELELRDDTDRPFTVMTGKFIVLNTLIK